MINEIETLATEIATAARKAFLKLFENKERYYYCALLTTGEGLSPIISAWSWEALEIVSKKKANPDSYAKLIKWSYADSPYYAFGEEYFEPVQKMFSDRPSINALDEEAWNEELEVRLKALELVMKLIDKEGVFALNQPRSEVYINAELMSPDETNTERALRLNNAEDIKDWLEEAAE